MASGMPDYQRIIRPQYGKAQHMSYLRVAPAGLVDDLFTITGKGMIYGGFLRAYSDGSQKASYVWPFIDGDQYSNLTFESLNNFSLRTVYSAFVYAVKYDDVNFRYVVGFSPGITFEEEIDFKYYNDTADDAVVNVQLYYSLF